MMPTWAGKRVPPPAKTSIVKCFQCCITNEHWLISFLIDCNGVGAGTAYIDNCGMCVVAGCEDLDLDGLCDNNGNNVPSECALEACGWGDADSCRWCEMDGLCRQQTWLDDTQTDATDC